MASVHQSVELRNFGRAANEKTESHMGQIVGFVFLDDADLASSQHISANIGLWQQSVILQNLSMQQVTFYLQRVLTGIAKSKIKISPFIYAQ